MSTTTKWKVGGYLIPVTQTIVGKRIELEYPFSRELTAEIKMMDGARWHGFDEHNPRKVWSIANSIRNRFQIDYLSGANPYIDYDKPIIEVPSNRSLYSHQSDLYRHGYTRRYGIWASEMGTGKSLAAIELCERLQSEYNIDELKIWFIGPKAAVKALRLELNKWKARFNPVLMTYEALTTTVKEWRPGQAAPQIVIFDEASKIKTVSAQRTQAAMHLAEAVREEHGPKGCVMLMSGSPAPKSPVDWWSLCETACPGFIKEGNTDKFKRNLCIIEQREGLGGALYPHMVAWLDDALKCKHCGQYKDDPIHIGKAPTAKDTMAVLNKGFTFGGGQQTPATQSSDAKPSSLNMHVYESSTNEVARLYKRMNGLVMVKFKKDCLDLPEKQYRVVQVKPTVEMVRAARMIKTTSRRAIEALTLMRELSDGFLYKDRQVGEQTCRRCEGTGQVTGAAEAQVDESTGVILEGTAGTHGLAVIKIECPCCKGTKLEPVMERYAEEVGSPKDEALVELLEENEEDGRIVIWSGFEGSIHRCVEIVQKEGWSTLKIDGKGWVGQTSVGETLDADELLIAMDMMHPRRNELSIKYPKIAVIGNPKAGGMALTLTAAKMCVYYSNPFDGEARMQSEDRIHRPGADHNRGVTIVDIFCLSTDELVLNNLRKKRKLQDLTMGELSDE
jgi:hypothetical protein